MTNTRRPVGEVVGARVQKEEKHGKRILVRTADRPGPSHIHIHNDRLEEGDKAYVEILSYGDSDGYLYAQLINIVAESEEFSNPYDEYTAERVEWRGTEQDIPSVEEREKNGFAETRDNKNDLLNGHM